MKIELDIKTVLAVLLIIICGAFFTYLPYLEKKNPIGYNKIPTGSNIEHFPSTMRYTDNIRKEPKTIIPRIVTTMAKDAAKDIKSLPDDYMYLYGYEKNFDNSKVYGDFSSRLEAYHNFLLQNKNNFHNLEAKDIDNLTKLLNGKILNEMDIPNNFRYKQEFKAVNH